MLRDFPIQDFFEEPAQRKPRGKKKRIINENKIDNNFKLKQINPKTNSQEAAFEHFSRGYNLLLSGSAGTGKTFISLYLGIKELLNSKFKKVCIVRSAVPTRDIGFLPGSAKDKLAVYEAPYQAIFTELFGRADAYNVFKLKKMVEFIPTSFIRGLTMDDTLIIVDECQNLSEHELDSIITRVGNNSKIIFSGDYMQSDFTKESEKNGIKSFSRILERMNSFRCVNFSEKDIVRSGLVKEYIITKNKMN